MPKLNRDIARANLVLLGEAPGNYPKYDHKRHALFPYPPRCAGARLKDLMGMSMGEYIRLTRRNLLDFHPGFTGKGAKFPIKVAREAVEAAGPWMIGTNVLIVGKRLSRAFGYQDHDIMHWHHQKDFNFAIVPHPSGVNLWWNVEYNRNAGRVFLESVAEQARAGAQSFVNPGAR